MESKLHETKVPSVLDAPPASVADIRKDGVAGAGLRATPPPPLNEPASVLQSLKIVFD